ncbi:hypothetical protein RO3G_09155 [Rhizopus delemar RA 99-880]|uniref:Pacifastin domain-containing protein n=1 Tax=Rhizopus delemar (strain RA 99-880 / ATCC MYA-4621 / FGSC 9543 / NRRL 43880) TaxID=246409 RepID=I1C7L5_RHIO9|nr:hypothetical protein RO3G_09155 [Rhizopus delemar RA 99-880]KAG1049669.1 hypothetical protein G6F43_008011 [Rhizopus delemar]|eukprot:EIE84445.1 hypothetical protein RO3G_09155 [Rhizopus delemar RA 99-880]
MKTLLLFLLLIQAVITLPASETCKQDEQFKAKDLCNVCTCTEDGLKADADCTKLICLFNKDRSGAQCTPYTSFPAKSSTFVCFCPESGVKAEAGCLMLNYDEPIE